MKPPSTRLPAIAGRVAELGDRIVQASWPLSATTPRARRDEPHDRLRHRRDAAATSATSRASSSTRGCAAASAGASSRDRAVMARRPAWSPAAAGTSVRCSCSASSRPATGSRARPQRLRRSSGRRRVDHRRHPRPRSSCAVPSTAATSSSTTSPRCRWRRDEHLLRTVNVDGTALLLQRVDAGRRRQGRAHVVECCVRRAGEQSGAAVDGARRRSRRTATPSSPPRWACLEAASKGLDVTIVRPRTILGHGRLGIFGILFEWVADGADIFVLGDGDNRYQFVHADDLAEVCMLAGGVAGPAIFNVGTDRFGTMRESLESLCTHAGTGSRVQVAPGQAGRRR